MGNPLDRRRLIVVSNRLPVTFRRGPGGVERVRSTGGLVAALEPTLVRNGGVWIGWPGSELADNKDVAASETRYRLAPVTLSARDVRDYYSGLSNRALWPLFHTMPGRCAFSLRDWERYEEVNARFAAVTARHTRPRDLVWIQDYHLMLAPLDLRRRRRNAAIGFFLHIPFPPYDVFRLIPWAKALLRGVLAADLVGFHVEGYVRNFLDCAQRLVGATIDRRRQLVSVDGATARVGAFPIGIDYHEFAALAQRAAPSNLEQQQVVLGVDRLDYTKGIPQRIRAFARLLDSRPEHRQRVTLLQLAVPSRSEVEEYRRLKREIDELVGRVNGRFGTPSWTPIQYLYRSYPPERLAALYRDADVALVTPLRDGMNLVAKEYVACQVKDPGVLILSHLAGAAETMHEALLVNPYNLVGTADALHRALIMPAAERQARMRALQERERRHNVHAWARVYMRSLARRTGRRPSGPRAKRR
jgi:trehalose 6-phosphate synthase/phosphatase